MPIKRWRYTYDTDGEMTLSFENLGFALLADCENDKNHSHQIMLTHLLKQPSFIPGPNDFESFVTICLLKKTTLLLRAFLQSY